MLVAGIADGSNQSLFISVVHLQPVDIPVHFTSFFLPNRGCCPKAELRLDCQRQTGGDTVLADQRPPARRQSSAELLCSLCHGATGVPRAAGCPAHVCDRMADFPSGSPQPSARRPRQAALKRLPGLGPSSRLHAGWSGYDWADCSFSRPKRDYCRRHGYLLLDERHYAPEDALPLHWWMYPQAARFRKLQYLEQPLRARLPCRYFFWLDGDALFVDQNRSVQAQLEVVRQTIGPNATDDPVFVLVALHKRYGLNNGMWLVENSPRAHAAVLDMYNSSWLSAVTSPTSSA
eukprot:g41748.t1